MYITSFFNKLFKHKQPIVLHLLFSNDTKNFHLTNNYYFSMTYCTPVQVYLFAWVDFLHPTQQFFTHFGTYSWVSPCFLHLNSVVHQNYNVEYKDFPSLQTLRFIDQHFSFYEHLKFHAEYSIYNLKVWVAKVPIYSNHSRCM